MQLQDLVLAAAGLFQLSAAANNVQAFQKVEFSNVGFTGSYTPVSSIKNPNSDECSCSVGSKEWFSGTNAPISEAVSVHFRGPLILNQFAFYNSSSFTVGDNDTSSSWNRVAYFNASSQTGENVTFLTKAGTESPVLGKALTFAASDGVSSSESAAMLAEDTLIKSDDEYVIFSNVSCPKSSTKKSCGVYRSGIPAFHGFEGVTKMFLFDFEMPTETQTNSSSFNYYDLPAIWLLNDQIPRTSQYPTNANCSCWASGCGEFDIFEVMNGTEKNHLYSTFHTFQGIEDLGTGIQANGYIARDTSNSMKGGVVFDSDGNTVVFMSNSTSFDQTISPDTLNGILAAYAQDETVSTKLATISATAPSTTSKSNAHALFEMGPGKLWFYAFTFLTSVAHTVLF
ncbi:LAME_0G04060g1_1 [Lachancea meyersii CBS 8951]|uniref:glucan endo-1,3-beta-D-glucosidase n=1 Tax=Lachancea meyersii CBS 8951 TaxID=1266667 RepID=A0A1G4K6U7_9SACH|nr:LAME_0G04060g1_1 [Lachancea meyersii CBS 8951]